MPVPSRTNDELQVRLGWRPTQNAPRFASIRNQSGRVPGTRRFQPGTDCFAVTCLAPAVRAVRILRPAAGAQIPERGRPDKNWTMLVKISCATICIHQ